MLVRVILQCYIKTQFIKILELSIIMFIILSFYLYKRLTNLFISFYIYFLYLNFVKYDRSKQLASVSKIFIKIRNLGKYLG